MKSNLVGVSRQDVEAISMDKAVTTCSEKLNWYFPGGV